MKRGWVLLFIFILLPIMSASSVDDEIQKITHYAEEYEIGNINYVKLMLHISSSRESMNELLGAREKYLGGVVKKEKLREILGEPNEDTKWVWVEGENSDIKIDEAVPVWKKIIFDGKKIQIRMEAFPSIFKKDEFSDFETEIEEGSIIYRLHFSVEFKKPQEQINIQSKIDEIEELAKSGADMDTLARKSVNAEMTFRSYFEQGGGKCEDIMKAIFGSENQRQTQKILLNEIEFFENDKFEAIIRLEMCDDCEWNYINLDMRLEGREYFEFKGGNKMSPEQFSGIDAPEFKVETLETIEKIRGLLEQGDYSSAMSYIEKIRMLSEAWNKKANDVWEQIEKEKPVEQPEGNNDPYWWIKQDQVQRQKAEDLRKQNYEERKAFYLMMFSAYDKKEYYFEQTDFERRLIEKFKEKGMETCDNNQDDNENDQVDCDDAQCGGKICGRGITRFESENGTTEIEIDYYCIAGTCQAKEETNETKGPICGNHICEENENVCLSSSVKCDNVSECSLTADCGSAYCSEDCIECPEYEAINCSGRVEFSGKDENGCLLEPICIEETEYCETSEDCPQPICGVADCVKEEEDQKGKCEIITLTKCEEGCTDGEKQIKECSSGEEITSAVCVDNVWSETEARCSEGEDKQCDEYCRDYISTIMPECPGNLKVSGISPDCKCDWICEEIVKNECQMASDCGGKNDVCSNGRCETIPEKIEVISEIQTPEQEVEETSTEQISNIEESTSEPEEETSSQEEISEEPKESVSEPEPSSEEPQEAPSTGEIIFGFFQTLISKLGITGHAIEEETSDSGDSSDSEISEESSSSSESQENSEEESSDSGTQDYGEPGPAPEESPDEEQHQEQNYQEYREDEKGDWEEKDKDERAKYEQENKERCKKECVRPCVERCIRDVCGENMDCNIDSESKSCENDCSADSDCVEKCMQGGDWWQEFEDEDMHKEEKGVFQVGGGCRKEQGRTDGFIWFGGWGDPFGEMEKLKHQYYEKGDRDWCKYEIENMIKQREEIEKGFNQEFAVWFFEKYLANSAEKWEQAQNGIFELYWHNVENQMKLASNMKCMNKNDVTDIMNVNLINIEYETKYGKLEYWEKLKRVKMPDLDSEVTVISPYMRVWIFPSKEFIKYEMEEAMKNHELPGSPEEKLEKKNQKGLTEQQKQEIKNDEKAMKRIKEISEEYDGNFDLVIQFKDYQTGEIVFNIYAQINEKDIMKIESMLPSEVGQVDATVEMDFDLLYDMIFVSEKDMREDWIESPPWDRKIKPVQKMKEIGNGIKMWNKMRSLKNSAIITPDKNKGEIEEITGWIMENVMGGGPEGPDEKKEDFEGDKGEEKGVWESKEKLTGEIIG
ncbi:MAG: hypothetical protein ABIH65_00070 [Nanoarchaeota archaeon]